MGSKYVDSTAIIQVIGCVYTNPSLLDFTDKYSITDEDFVEDIHKVIFGSIYKLHEYGSKIISLETIADYLSGRPKSEAIYKQNRGEEWLTKVSDVCAPDAFDYYYNRLKKMTLLRAYDNYGIDVRDIYDPDNILDVKKKQLQEEYLDNASLIDIANLINQRIDEIKIKYVDGDYGEASQAGDDIFDLINQFKEVPEVGVPLYGSLINSVCRGARLGKFYLRSAATGVGRIYSLSFADKKSRN